MINLNKLKVMGRKALASKFCEDRYEYWKELERVAPELIKELAWARAVLEQVPVECCLTCTWFQGSQRVDSEVHCNYEIDDEPVATFHDRHCKHWEGFR